MTQAALLRPVRSPDSLCGSVKPDLATAQPLPAGPSPAAAETNGRRLAYDTGKGDQKSEVEGRAGPAPRGPRCSLARGHITRISASLVTRPPALSPPFPPLPSSALDPGIRFRTHLIIQDSPIPRSLIYLHLQVTLSK